MSICEALGAIGGLQPETLLPLLGDVLRLLTELSDVVEPTAQQALTKVMLCTLMFQSMSGYRWNKETWDVMQRVVKDNDLWSNYRVARAAVRYGHHGVACHVFAGLKERVSSEHLHFWLTCLKEVSDAEARLVRDDEEEGVVIPQPALIERLNFAVVHYNKAVAALKVSNGSVFDDGSVTDTAQR